jgi:hypothetical protein
MGIACSMNEGDEKAYILIGGPEEKGSFEDGGGKMKFV